MSVVSSALHDPRAARATPVAARGRALNSGLPWPSPAWTMPLWCFFLTFAWSRVTRHQVATAVAPGASSAEAVAAAAITLRVIGTLLEAGFFALVWRRRTPALPFWRFAAYVAFGSCADLLAYELLSAFGPDSGRFAPWLIPVVGPAALPKATALAQPGLATAFASLGLLTVLRWLWTASAQARALGRSIAVPLLLTALLWLATHAALWWTLDLMRGRSVAG